MKYVPNNRGKSVLFGKDGLPLTYDEYNALYKNKTSYTGEYPNWNLTSSGIVQNQENYKAEDPLLKGVWQSNQNYINSGNVTKDIQSYYDLDNKTWATAQDFVNAYNADAEKIRSTWNTDHAWEATGATAHNQLHKKMFGSRNTGTYNASTGVLGYDTKHEDNFGTTTFYRRMDRYDGEYETLTPEQRKARTHTINTPSGPVQVFKKANGDLLLLDSNNEPVKTVNPNNPAEVETEAEKVAIENPVSPAVVPSYQSAPAEPLNQAVQSPFTPVRNPYKWVPVANAELALNNNWRIYNNAVKGAQITPKAQPFRVTTKNYDDYVGLTNLNNAANATLNTAANIANNRSEINDVTQILDSSNQALSTYTDKMNSIHENTRNANAQTEVSVDNKNKEIANTVANKNLQYSAAAQRTLLDADSKYSTLNNSALQSGIQGFANQLQQEGRDNAINYEYWDQQRHATDIYNASALRTQYVKELENATQTADWSWVRNYLTAPSGGFSDEDTQEYLAAMGVESANELNNSQLAQIYQMAEDSGKYKHLGLANRYRSMFAPILDKISAIENDIERSYFYKNNRMPLLEQIPFGKAWYKANNKPTDYSSIGRTTAMASGGSLKKVKSERELWLEFVKQSQLEFNTRQKAAQKDEELRQKNTKMIIDNISKEELLLLKSIFK